MSWAALLSILLASPAAVPRLIAAGPAQAPASADTRRELAPAPKEGAPPAKPPTRPQAPPRGPAIHALCQALGVGPGATVADIGAGSGMETWNFAAVVGPAGTVYAEELSDGQVQALAREADKRKLPQVRPVRGRPDTPGLPPQSLELAYLRLVYHHLTQPREMLRATWAALKPGGYLVIVDQNRGTLRDWVPLKVRKGRHVWTAETTVVREAREEGFAFVRLAEDGWPDRDAFVLVFQRPHAHNKPGADPDRPRPLPAATAALLQPLGRPYRRPVFVALGEGRGLMAPLLRDAAGPGLDVVLEEWATRKDERPPRSAGPPLPSVLTTGGDPHLGPEPVDAVFFLDSYHLLFHGPTLLARLRDRLAPGGLVAVLDRTADRPLSRRAASHHRRIDPAVVKDEMARAGFVLWAEAPPPAPDRFLLLFGRAAPGDVKPDDDPLFAGPSLPAGAGEWLCANAWRLRGFRPADGPPVRRREFGRPLTLERVGPETPDRQTWRVAGEDLVLVLEKLDGGWKLRECWRP